MNEVRFATIQEKQQPCLEGTKCAEYRHMTACAPSPIKPSLSGTLLPVTSTSNCITVDSHIDTIVVSQLPTPPANTTDVCAHDSDPIEGGPQAHRTESDGNGWAVMDDDGDQ